MKPDWMPQEEYTRRRAEARVVMATIDFGPLQDWPPLVDIVVAQRLLAERVLAEGGTVAASDSLCEAMGQASYPPRDPWKLGDALLARWRAGRAPVCGPEFAEELSSGTATDLPPPLGPLPVPSPGPVWSIN